MKADRKSVLIGILLGFVPFGFLLVSVYVMYKGTKRYYSVENKNRSFDGFIKSVQDEASKEVKWKRS